MRSFWKNGERLAGTEEVQFFKGNLNDFMLKAELRGEQTGDPQRIQVRRHACPRES